MLEVKNIKKNFGKLSAVKDVSLAVTQGMIRGLIGPNGSGKTTTFNLITGFLKPTAGRIVFGGRDITGMGSHRIAALGMVRTFQLTSVYGDLSVFENVEVGHHLALASGSIGQSELAGSVERILDFMELSRLKEMPARLLPAGSQRMLSVATAIASSPKLLMLDEPLAGLNPTEKAKVVQKIKLLRNNGLSVLLVEHDLKSVMSLCDELTVINFGARIAEGTPSEITSNQQVIEAYIGPSGVNHA